MAIAAIRIFGRRFDLMSTFISGSNYASNNPSLSRIEFDHIRPGLFAEAPKRKCPSPDPGETDGTGLGLYRTGDDLKDYLETSPPPVWSITCIHYLRNSLRIT